MKIHLLLALTVSLTYAYPGLPIGERAPEPPTSCEVSKQCNAILEVSDHEIGLNTKLTETQKLSAARNNCGNSFKCERFSANDQIRPITGKHAFIAPTKKDVRGPCPGLNAAANHGYIARNGLVDFQHTTISLAFLYSMGREVTALLVAYAIFGTGDTVSMRWAIGRGFPYKPRPEGGILNPPPLLHNVDEGDGSMTRCDAAVNGGDAFPLSTGRYKAIYSYRGQEDRFTMDKLAQAFAKNTIRSVKGNADYFAPLISTTVIVPVMYNFAIAFMSNHTAEEPAGYLDGNILNHFFAVQGTYPNLKWEPYQERIPPNWYARPAQNGYKTVNGLFEDLVIGFNAYPTSVRFGGNVKGKDSYKPIDIPTFSNEVYPQSTPFNRDALACMFLQDMDQEFSNQWKLGSEIVEFVMPPDCPQSRGFNESVYRKYPGYYYSAPTNTKYC